MNLPNRCDEWLSSDRAMSPMVFCAEALGLIVALIFLVSNTPPLESFPLPTAMNFLLGLLLFVGTLVMALAAVAVLCSVPGANVGFFLLILVVAAHVAFIIFSVTRVPVFGWDALDFWASYANHLINEPTAYVDAGAPSSEPNYNYRAAQRHGDFLSRTIASLALFSERGVQLFYVFCTVHIFFTFILYSSIVTKNVTVSCVLGLAVLTSPLLVNHSAAIAYSELPTAAVLLSAAVLLDIFLRGEGARWRLFFLSVILLALSAVIRSTSVLYVLAVVLSAVGVLLQPLIGGAYGAVKSLAKLGFFAVPLCLFLGLALEGAPLSLLLQEESGELVFAGRIIRFSGFDFTIILQAISHALFSNMSFSVLFLTCIIFYWAVAERKGPQGGGATSLFGTSIFSYLPLIVVVYCEGLLSTRYGVAFGLPSRDTFLSRSLLPLLVLSACSIPWLFRHLDRPLKKI